jgi:DNA transposition AAA+ family ATPase
MNRKITEELVQDARAMTEAWTPMNKTLTPEELDAERKLIKLYIEEMDYSLGQVARQVDMSETTLSQVLSGKYPSNPADHLKAIRLWIDNDRKKQNSPKFEGFVFGRVAQYIAASLDFAAKTNVDESPANIAIIYGPSGWGKTMTAKTWATKHPGTIYLRINSGMTTVRGFLVELCTALRLPAEKGVRGMIESIVDRLRNSGRMLILDEAHQLIYRLSLNFKVFEVIRDIHDLTNCPVALIGTSKIIRMLDEGCKDTRNWITDQFGGRVCIQMDIIQAVHGGGGGGGGGKFAFTQQEIAKILQSDKVKLHPQVTRWLAELASIPGKGGVRKIKRVVMMAQIIQQQNIQKFPNITLDLVKAAYSQLSNGDTINSVHRDEDEMPQQGKEAAAG